MARAGGRPRAGAPAGRRRPALLDPRVRPDRPLDLANRDAVIARQRHTARRRRVARRSLRLLAGIIAVALGVAGIAAAVTWGGTRLRTTPYLAVREVSVVGTKRLGEAQVVAAAGIEPGGGILALDPDAIQDRIESLPGVKSARVVRHLPGRIVLLVEERQPYALVNAPGAPGGFFWIDPDGHVVSQERRPGVPALPVLSGVTLTDDDGERPVGDRLEAGLALLRVVQRIGGRVAGRISEIDLGHAEGPVLYTVDNVAVRLGHQAWEERLARLDGVLGELEERGERVDLVDLRFQDQVVLRPRSVGGPTEAVRARPAGTRRVAPPPAASSAQKRWGPP